MILDFKNSKISLIGKVYELPRDSDKNIIKFDIENFTFLQEDEISRIDKLAYRVFNDDKMWESLSKINGIQDPFILDKDSSFLIVNKNFMDKVLKTSNNLKLTYDKTSNKIKSTLEEISTIDKARQERISKIVYKFGEVPTELRKPIYLRTDETNLTLENNIIST